MKSKPDSIDEYLAAVSSPKRAALQSLQRTIRAAAPQAQECISYGLPAFRQGRMLVAFGAKANHCALYLMSDKTLAGFRSALEGLETSKGTVRFQDDRPLPATLVRKLVKARLAENAALDAASKRKPESSAHRASGISSRRAAKRLSAARKPARRKG